MIQNVIIIASTAIALTVIVESFNKKK